MRLSNYFLPILKENPAEAKIASHRLMLRAGMIRQVNSGIYNWLPLGLKVLRKVESIVRDSMNEAGCIELLMPCIQPAELWQESGRYEVYGKEMLCMKDRHDVEMLFGPTAEEVVTDIFRKSIVSYKDLPKCFYNIQLKFRDEIRPRFGIMRGREFLMKAAYSFDLDEKTALETYEHMFVTYLKTFKRLGVSAIPVRAETGAIGGDLSHEFQIVAETGESAIFYDKKFDELSKNPEVNVSEIRKLYAASDDIHDPKNCPLSKEDMVEKRGIEVGHIFNFGTKYTKAMNASVMGKDGKPVFPNCGSYGVGVSRLVGAIIEASHDDKGIIWPKEVAPFDLSLINLKPGHDGCDKLCNELYEKLSAKGLDILYDDTKSSAGNKFATHDLIGMPYQFVIGPRGAENNKVEIKERVTGQKQELDVESALSFIVG